MSKSGYILSIDQGTTSSRAALVSEDGNIICQKNMEFKQYFPRNGWVEHDPRDILSTSIECINSVIRESGIDSSNLLTAGITNQRETVVAWNKRTGEPVYNAIVWQDRRTEDFCKSLKEWLINHGVNFLFKTNVNSLKKNKTKLIGIETDKGFIESNKLIVCAGSLTDRIIETKPHIIPVRGYSLTLPKGSVPFDVSLTLSDQRILFTKLGKKVRITGFADFFSKTQDDKKRIQELLRSAKSVAPNLADYDSSSIEAWSGDRPLTPSSIPFIGPSKTQGVYINSGHGFYGWTLSFSSGKKIANYF